MSTPSKKPLRISLLHATRGRPDKALAAKQQWLSSAKYPEYVEHIFGVDEDDASTLNVTSGCPRVVVEKGKGCVLAWNSCAELSTGDILVQLSDDWKPALYWDEILRDQFNTETGPCVLAISDGHRNDDLLCMAILNRARYKQQGYLFHPKFLSVFSDNYFTWAAKKDGVLKDARHIVFEHEHPIFGKGEMDNTYRDSNSEARYIQGHMTFNELTRPPNATVCLAMIVKNEIDVIERCLRSVKDYIHYWIICDTGSTDGTQQKIKDLMQQWGIAGELHERPWVDFATNRTESLALARDKTQYTLIIDADDQLEVEEGCNVLSNLCQDLYQFRITHCELTYYRTQLVNNAYAWKYVGVLHEFITAADNVPMTPPVRVMQVHMIAAASDKRHGFSGKNKYVADALILEKALLDTDIDAHLKSRYMFYLAQSYRDAGMWVRAEAAYEERVAMGGWEEEVYYSKHMIAKMKAVQRKPILEIIDAFTQAWEYRPSRLEALYDLIILLKELGRNTLAYAYVRIGISIPASSDILFVRADVLSWRMLNEFAILSFFTGNKVQAYKACNALVNSPAFASVPEVDQTGIRSNLVEFAKHLN